MELPVSVAFLLPVQNLFCLWATKTNEIFWVIWLNLFFYKEACMPHGISMSVCVCVSQAIRSMYFQIFTLQGSLYAIWHSYECVYYRQSDQYLFKSWLYKEACMPYGVAVSVCVSQAIRLMYFQIFTLQGSLYAIQHSYECVCITGNQINIFSNLYFTRKPVCHVV